MFTTAKRLAKGLMLSASLLGALAPVANAGEREWCPPGERTPTHTEYRPGYGYGTYERYDDYKYRYGHSYYDRWGRYIGRDIDPPYPAPGYAYPAPGYAPPPGYATPAPGYATPAPGYGAYAPGYGEDSRWSMIERAQFKLGMLLGQIHYVKDNCTRQTINMEVADQGAANAQMALASPTAAFQAGYRKGQEMSWQVLETDGKDQFCQATWKKFGRHGNIWANLLVRPEAYK